MPPAPFTMRRCPLVDSASRPLLQRLALGLAGALGLAALVRFVPRLVGGLARRFVFGLVGEIAAVAVLALASKKAAERFGLAPPDDAERS